MRFVLRLGKCRDLVTIGLILKDLTQSRKAAKKKRHKKGYCPSSRYRSELTNLKDLTQSRKAAKKKRRKQRISRTNR